MINNVKGVGWFVLELYTPSEPRGDGILRTIRKYLGMDDEYTYFDDDLIVHINSVFSILNQLGVGPTEGFEIQDDLAQWDEFVSDEDYLEDVKTYVCLKVRLLFDPPTSSAAMEAINRSIDELEWCLNFAAESTKSN